ncbi:MAG: Ig-like domain-containing protein [Actinomycetaceae bacterium]|nr:Ig-like domain-containing protein [Actinomycetaceae bacterium]
MVGKTVRNRKRARRRSLPAIFILILALVASVLAVLHQGVPTTEVDVNDGGLWVINKDQQLVGHLDHDSRTLVGALRADTTEFDVGQNGNTVTVLDSGTNTVAPVDVAHVSLGAATAIPEGSLTAHGGERVGVLDPEAGYLWVAQAASPSSTSFVQANAVATDLSGGVLAASTQGKIAAASARGGTLVTIHNEGGVDHVHTAKLEGIDPAAELRITMVGESPVLFDTRSNSVRLPNGKIISLSDAGIPAGATLQESGPSASTVVLATPTALVHVNLDNGSVTSRPANTDNTPGTPAPPVRHRDCVYGAWGGSGAYIRQCVNSADDKSMVVGTLKNSADVRFRTNRSRIVLNDIRSGAVWLPGSDMVLMDDWEQVAADADGYQSSQDSPVVSEQVASPQRNEENTAPIAEDDEVGVRPGRTTTLPILSNDSDDDGDVLTARAVSAPGIGTVTTTRGGRALQITGVAGDAQGDTTFTYEASDGRAVDTASVRVAIHPWHVNEAPRQDRESAVRLGTEGRLEHNVLNDWSDPDGDPLFLSDATAPNNLEVQFREEGNIVLRDLGANPGRHTVTLKVSDGNEETTGVFHVDIQPPGNVAPVANADHYVTTVGENLSIEPLANDVDPNGDTLSLAAVSNAPLGSALNPDVELGSISFTAGAPGSYEFTYTVTDGPATALGVVRVDVVDVNAKATPVAEDDLVVLPTGGTALSAPLNNDSDPTGGVLVVQRIEVPAESGVEVTLVDRHLLRINAPGGLSEPATFTYTVSNGTGSATATVTVVPSRAQEASQPPQLQPDRIKVRVGDVASVPVLDNDRSPSGLAMQVDPNLSFTSNPNIGQPFVTGNLVRIEAGNTPGTIHAAYTVRDSAGNTSSETVTFQVLPVEGANAAPKPRPLTAWAASGETTRIPVPLHGVDPDGDSVTLVGIEQSPTKGTVQLGTEWLEYVPNSGSIGTDVFTYIVEDRRGKQATARVRVGIAEPSSFNQAPVAVADNVSARPNRRLSVSVLSNDVDADGDPITLEKDVSSAQGQVQPQARGQAITLTTPSQPGTYLVTYRVSDGRGGTGMGTLTINVSPNAPLQPPQARDDVVSVSELPGNGGAIAVPVLDNDEDPDGDVSDLRISTRAEGARVEGGKLIISPTPQRRLVVYTVTDPDGLSASAVVSVAGEDRTTPTLNPARIPVRVRGGQDVTLNVKDLVLVRPGRSPQIVDSASLRTSTGIEGGATLRDNTTISFKASQRWSGTASVTFTVRDGAADDDSALSATLSVPIAVESDENLPPVATPTEIRVAPNEDPVSTDLALMVRDPDGADPTTFTYRLVKVPDGITATLDGRTLKVQAGPETPKGPAGSLTVTVDDGSGAVEAHIPVRVVTSTRPLIQAPDIVIDDARAGETRAVNLSDYVANPFPDTPVRIMDVAVASGEGSAEPQDTSVMITPAATWRGPMLVSYRVIDATGDPSRIVQGNITLIVRDRPNPPHNVRATSTESGSATVSFEPGADNGAPITHYTITDGTGKSTDCVSTLCTITGLANGVEHSFSVVAHNSVGASEPSEMSAPVLVDIAPGPPQNLTAEAGNGSITWSWDSAISEGTPVTTYRVTIIGGEQPPRTVDVTGNSLTQTGLVNGTQYSASVVAINESEKTSTPSETVSATPWGQPAAPTWNGAETTGGSGNSAEVTLNWALGAANGPALDEVEIAIDGGAPLVLPASTTSHTVTVPAGSHTATIRARSTTTGTWSEAASLPFEARGTPMQLDTGKMSLNATGNHGEVSVAGAAVVSGNGFSAEDLVLEYSMDGTNWAPLGDTISVGRDGPVTVHVRQSSRPVEGKTWASDPVVLNGSAYGPPGPVNATLTPKDSGASLSWNVDNSEGNSPITQVEMIHTIGNGPETTQDLGSATSGTRDIAAAPGQEIRVRIRARNAAGQTTESAPASYTVPAPAPEPPPAPPQPPVTPEMVRANLSGSTRTCTPGGPSTCHVLKMQARQVAPGVTTLSCSVDHGGENYSFELPVGDTFSDTPIRLNSNDQSTVNDIVAKTNCTPKK